MVVCRYFQQGCCRFGNGCRYEHIFDTKYNYHVTQERQCAPQQTALDKLTYLVVLEANTTLKGGQWLLSCYAPFKGKINFPGLVDFSPEEIRLKTYQARATGNGELQQYIAKVKNVEDIYKKMYQELSNPTDRVLSAIQNLHNGNPVDIPFKYYPTEKCLSVGQSSESLARSIFGSVQTSALQAMDASAVASQNSFLPQPQQSAPATNSASALFASANAQLVAPTNNAQTQPQPPNIFAAPIANNNVFSSPFQAPAPPSQNVFELPQRNPFLANTFTNPTQLKGIVYSKHDSLCPEDITAYENDSFNQGSIPEMAPSYQLCK